MKLHLDDPDVKTAGLVASLVTYGQSYVKDISPNAFFILNHIFVYQTRFWNWEMTFGVIFVALIAARVPFNPQGKARQFIRDLAYLFLYVCSAALVWTAFFPGIAYGTPILWNNYALIYFGVLLAIYLAFLEWRHGTVGRVIRGLKRSNRIPFEHNSRGLKEPNPAASALGIRQFSWETLLALYPVLKDIFQVISRLLRTSRSKLRAIAVYLGFVIPTGLLFGSFPGSAVSILAPADPTLNPVFRYGISFFFMFLVYRLELWSKKKDANEPQRRESLVWHHFRKLPAASIL